MRRSPDVTLVDAVARWRRASARIAAAQPAFSQAERSAMAEEPGSALGLAQAQAVQDFDFAELSDARSVIYASPVTSLAEAALMLVAIMEIEEDGMEDDELSGALASVVAFLRGAGGRST